MMLSGSKSRTLPAAHVEHPPPNPRPQRLKFLLPDITLGLPIAQSFADDLASCGRIVSLS